MMTQRIVSNLLGIVIILFGIACASAAPLYMYVYNDREGVVAEMSAILAGLVLGSALVYAGARLLQLGSNNARLRGASTSNL